MNLYPVLVVQHLLHSLGRGNIFTKLDMAQTYQQLEVDDAFAKVQMIVTQCSAFRCRLQFGVCVAPGIFQCLMERLLYGLPGVIPYMFLFLPLTKLNWPSASVPYSVVFEVLGLN